MDQCIQPDPTVANSSYLETLTRQSTKIARAIVEGRPIATTGQLAEVVGRCAPPKERVKTLARVFQALRIEVGVPFDGARVSECLLGLEYKSPAFLFALLGMQLLNKVHEM